MMKSLTKKIQLAGFRPSSSGNGQFRLAHHSVGSAIMLWLTSVCVSILDDDTLPIGSIASVFFSVAQPHANATQPHPQASIERNFSSRSLSLYQISYIYVPNIL